MYRRSPSCEEDLRQEYGRKHQGRRDPTTHAIPMTTNVGNVTILGSDYNLSILYDSFGLNSNMSFNDLMPSITFTTQAAATAAVTSIDAAFMNFDWSPNNSSNGPRVAFATDGIDYDYMTVSGGNSPFGPFTQNVVTSNNFSP